MIAEIFAEAYDVEGKKVLRPDLRRKGPHPTFPMGRYLTQPLKVKCQSIADVRKFLRKCKYVSDKEQFGRSDYWQAPEDFEKSRRGDCDCFALWTWRQLLALGLEARFVMGRAGRYGGGHAWVQFSKDRKHYLLEPTMAHFGSAMPRLDTLQYHPSFSMAWDGANISFYQHDERDSSPSLLRMARFVPDWLIFWLWFWTMWVVLLPNALYRRLFSKTGAQNTLKDP